MNRVEAPFDAGLLRTGRARAIQFSRPAYPEKPDHGSQGRNGKYGLTADEPPGRPPEEAENAFSPSKRAGLWATPAPKPVPKPA